MSEIDASKVEFLKVWYSLFATLMDAHADGEYTDEILVQKLKLMRNQLVTRVPEVEAAMLERERKTL